MKLLLALSRWDVTTSSGRLINLATLLSNYSIDLTVTTTSEDVKNDLSAKVKGIDVMMPEAVSFRDSFEFRDDLVKTFVQKTYDIKIPGTGLQFWKTTAFDDFRGHITPHTYRQPKMDYDIILAPLPSSEDPLPDVDDIYYTLLFSEARQRRVKIVFFQLYPVYTAPMLFLRFGSFYIVRDGFERDFLINKGLEPHKIRIITHPIDKYLLSLISSPYMDMAINGDTLSHGRSIMEIVLINHAKYRPQIREILNVLDSIKVEKGLTFVMRRYTVRNMSEDEIAGEILESELKDRVHTRLRITDTSEMSRVVMCADVIISTFFLNALQLAADYGKAALIHNPSFYEMPIQEGVRITKTAEELRGVITGLMDKKAGLTDIMTICREIHGD